MMPPDGITKPGGGDQESEDRNFEAVTETMGKADRGNTRANTDRGGKEEGGGDFYGQMQQRAHGALHG